MKLIIQVPCFNEAQQLPATLAQLPRQMEGFDAVEWLVVDDGSTDDTAAVAIAHGVDHVVRYADNRGLAFAFSAGLEACCRRGADVIANVDADNQYHAEALPALCAPVREGRADIVVGCRPIASIAHFSRSKKLLQRLGSAVVRMLSGADVADATSGFRAYSRRAALTLNVHSRYTYTLETLVQARQARLVLATTAVGVNPPTRPSRLMRSTAHYLRRSVLTMLRAFVIYRPLRFFMVPAVVLATGGVALGVRFLVNFLQDGEAGNVQSLILASILVLLAGLATAIGLLADLLSVNRRLLEDLQASQRRKDWQTP